MAGWNLIQDILDGERPRIVHDLWDEIRAALAERVSAMVEVLSYGDFLPAAVAPRDPIGSITAYRAAAEGLVDSPFGDWGKEETAVAWGDADRFACLRYTTDPTAGSKVNVFEEAGFGDDWTLPAPAGARPRAAYWSDFAPVLNLVTFMRVLDHALEAVPFWQCHHLTNDYNHHTSGTWADARASEWSATVDPSDDQDGVLGKYAFGEHFSDDHFTFGMDVRIRLDRAVDLSPLWLVEHLGESACDPVRVAICFQYRGPQSGAGRVAEGCSFEVHISGDRGANWWNWGALTAEADGAWTGVKIVLTDDTLWTAAFMLRLSLLDDPNADTPAWTDPGSGESSEYDARASLRNLSIFAEFEWSYKA